MSNESKKDFNEMMKNDKDMLFFQQQTIIYPVL